MNNLDHRNYVAPRNLLHGRVILITGAGAGIGREAAIQFAAHGATCVLLGRQVPQLESLYDQIVASGSPEPAIYPMDLMGAEEPDYDELSNRLIEQLGHIDGVLINAAKLSTIGPIEFADAKEFVQVLHTNVTSTFLLIRALLPALKSRPDASVLTTSAQVGREARAFWGAYAVSKFGLEGLTQVLAEECANSSVRVNSVNPGATRTRLRATAFPAEDPATLPAPAAIMPTYLYLMGSDSQGVNGQALDAQ